jgi:hypothetical protein
LIGSGPKEKAYIQSYRTSVKFKAEKNHKKLFIGMLQRRGTKIDLLETREAKHQTMTHTKSKE